MKILMVCLGNICRSPLAEGILRSKISNKHTVASAGTISFHEGEQPDKRSISTAKEHGVDISKQKAQYFEKKFFDKFDKIFDMKLEENAAKFMSEDKVVHIDLIEKNLFKVSINEKNDLQRLKEVDTIEASCDQELNEKIKTIVDNYED